MNTPTLDGAARFALVSADDGANSFVAAYVERPSRWNGWAFPWFREAEAARITALIAGYKAAGQWESAESFEYHPDRPPASRFTCVPPEGEAFPVDVLPDPHRPGEHVYGVGTGIWTWEEQGFPPGTIVAYRHRDSVRTGVVLDDDLDAPSAAIVYTDWWNAQLPEMVTMPAESVRPLVTDEDYADVIMLLVDADIIIGRVPVDVATYSELHDYVDANWYGDAAVPYSESACTCDAPAETIDGDHGPTCGVYVAYDVRIDTINRATGIADARLRARAVGGR